MGQGWVAASDARLEAIEAIESLREAHDAYRALGAMLEGQCASLSPADLGALMRSLTGRFGADLARAEAAVNGIP